MEKYDVHKIKTATTTNAIAADGILQYYLKSARLLLDIDGYPCVLLALNTNYIFISERFQ